MCTKLSFSAALCLFSFVAPARADAGAISFTLASGGKALAPIVIAPHASALVRESASSLASMLSRMTGVRFEVVEGDGVSGIAVGVRSDFPALEEALAGTVTSSSPLSREDYLLRSRAKGLLVMGASPVAVDHAVWDLLYRLGYRQFFPGELWEVVPRKPSLALEVDVLERPSFRTRRIWYGHGFWGYDEESYKDWVRKNRLGGLELSSGHMYGKIVHRSAEAFRRHPEWLGLMGGTRKSSKLCISNPGLREHVAEFALRFFAEHRDAESISMEPSDGRGWCECDACRRLGSPSTRAVLLASFVARKVEARFGPKRVGMYAYNEHALPPDIDVDPNVIVSVATAYLPKSETAESLMNGWRSRGAELGVREYFSVNAWDRDLPGAARASNLAYLSASIPRAYAAGARYFSAESSESFGPSGLGFYFAARVLWDVGEAAHVERVREDFLLSVFPQSKTAMETFYRLIDGASRPLLSEDLVGRMYEALDRALSFNPGPLERRRIEALILYTRYVELFRSYDAARGDARQTAFESLIRHVYRMRGLMLVHAKALYRTLPKRDRAVTVPEQARWDVPTERNPWKDERSYASSEVMRFLNEGKAKNSVMSFRPVSFSEEVAPLLLDVHGTPTKERVTTSSMARTSASLTTRGDVSLLAFVPEGQSLIRLTLSSGLFRPERNHGVTRVSLAKARNPSRVELFSTTFSQDRASHEVVLPVPEPGAYIVEIRDNRVGTTMAWAPGAPIAVRAVHEMAPCFHGRTSLSFFVPAGTKVVGGYAGGPGVVRDGAGHVVRVLDALPQYFEIPVPIGQDGKAWRFENGRGSRVLMTVPPLLFRSVEEAVAPRDLF